MKKILKWVRYGRSMALPQSVMPAVLAVVMATASGNFHIGYALLAVLGVACAHLAMNIADDWFDYRVDMLSDRDRVIRKGFRAMTVKYPYLTDGTETLRTTAYAIAQFIVVALACGAGIFVYWTELGGFASNPQGTWILVAIVLICAFLGVFYSAPPFKLAYHGFGEPIIGFIFGPLLMCGTFYASCGSLGWDIIFMSVPVGLLVLNILFTHSFIDMPGDAESNKMTFARLLGTNKACLVASALFSFLPFAIVVAGAVLGLVHPLFLVVLLDLPRAIWLWRSLLDFSRGVQRDFSVMPRWMGPMAMWDDIRKAGVEWFMARWYGSRNILSGFCLLAMTAALIIRIFAL